MGPRLARLSQATGYPRQVSAEELTLHVGARTGDVTGLWWRPRGARALYVFAHGAGAGMRHHFMEAACAALAERRIATLRYAFPYSEAGRKRPDHRNVLEATVRAAVAEGVRRGRGLPVLAGGKSMGGRMTSQAAAKEALPGVRGLVFHGFPLHGAGKPSDERAAHLTDVGLPMLFLQGTRDALADLDLLAPVCRALGPAAQLHIVEGADHSFHVLKRSGRTEEEVLEELSDAVAEFASKVG